MRSIATTYCEAIYVLNGIVGCCNNSWGVIRHSIDFSIKVICRIAAYINSGRNPNWVRSHTYIATRVSIISTIVTTVKSNSYA